MTRFASFLSTPLRRALFSAVSFAGFAVVFRYAWGVFDPAMQSWSMLFAAPVVGFVTYLQASNQTQKLAKFFVWMGAAGLVFWTVALLSGVLPVRERIEWLYVAVIFAFPLVALGMGVWQLRRKA